MLLQLLNIKNCTTGVHTITRAVNFTVYDVICMSHREYMQLNMRLLIPHNDESNFTVSLNRVYHYTYYCDRPTCVPAYCLSLYMYWHSRLCIYYSKSQEESFVFRLTSDIKIRVIADQIYYCVRGADRRPIPPRVQFMLSSDAFQVSHSLKLYVEGSRCGFIIYLRMIVALSLAQDPDMNY